MISVNMDGDVRQKISQAYTLGTEGSAESLKIFYDKWSNLYDKDMDKIYNGPKLIAKAFSEIVSDRQARILDCGCGTGLVGIELNGMGFDNIGGVDISEESLRVARDKGVYVNLKMAALGPDPLDGVQKDSYDDIICSGCFGPGHINDNVLLEWTRIVKPGGYIVICVNERFIHFLKGDTFKKLVDSKVIEVEVDYSVSNYKESIDEHSADGHIFVLKVLS